MLNAGIVGEASATVAGGPGLFAGSLVSSVIVPSSTRLPNAKSVSERIWLMSHYVRPNPRNVSPVLVSQVLVIQEVARLCYGYNACQTSHHVRPNTLAATVRPNPISVRAHHTVHRSLLTSFLRHVICREEAELSIIRRTTCSTLSESTTLLQP